VKILYYWFPLGTVWKEAAQYYLPKLLTVFHFFTPSNNISMSWFINKVEIFKTGTEALLSYLLSPAFIHPAQC
jgi:hypothetical protein